jgi:hypothetical protein
MAAACAFMILSLCLPPEMTPPETHDRILSADAMSSGPGFRLGVAIRSDVHQVHDGTRSPRACAGGACVHYVRTCAAPLACDYQVWRSGEGARPLGFRLEARTPEAWRWATEHLTLMVGPSGEARLPLAALRERSRPVGG